MSPDPILETPPLVEPPAVAGVEFDVGALDPANFGKAVPPTQDEPVADPLVTPDPTKTPDPVPVAKPEPKNFAELRKLRAAAETERDQFKAERDSLAAKVADLEPKATTYEKEREGLQKRLEEREAAVAQRDAALRRTSARETPAWKEKADLIHVAAKNVEDILSLPDLKDAGITHSMETLLNPHSTEAINATVRALHDAGRPLEAAKLIRAHTDVQDLRASLRAIEAESVEEAKTWAANREAALTNTFRSVRDQLSAANPIHDARSPEFLALPKPQQDFLTGQHQSAQAAAQRVMALADNPEALAADAYQSALARGLFAASNKGAKETVAAQEIEIADLKSRLSAYEKAAGGASPVGGGTGGTAAGESLEDIAKSLDPSKMPGYRGGIVK